MIIFTLLFLAAFLLGSIPTAYLFGIWFRKTDIRQQGSGNVGATNAVRVFGKKIGAFVFLIDFLKGFIPAFFLPSILVSGESATASNYGLWIGLGSIMGHVFTPFLGFKGGKGVATGSGVLCASYPILYLLTTLVWVASFTITRLVSLSSLIASAALLIFGLLFRVEALGISFFIVVCAFIFWTHRSNLHRLWTGKEKRI